MTNLRRHVPELALQWAVAEPDARWRLLDGTLCFADISGFTALAERLAQRGRMGGEELVETLGRVFTTMLGIARERGGGMLKFGGDALLLFFQGPEHAVQAASAAVEMRAALRAAAKIPTSVGPLRLSMSVGLHSGPTHFFLVGSTHRELVVLGPSANAVVAVESAAGAGEILVSAATEASLPPGSVRARADGERLLRWRKPAVAACGASILPDETEDVASRLFPAALGEQLATGSPDPEHRVACIAFIRFSGTDAILENRGPEVVAAALDSTIGRTQQVLEEEGVTLLAVDLDRDGGKLFMTAGIPQAHEDDEGVMLRALRRIMSMDLPLVLQAGVNRGHVFAAEVGDSRRAAFSAMGDTTNTAARIMSKTPIGKIYAHPETLDECLTLYEATPAEPLQLKGKAAPLVVYEVGAEIGLREREGLSVDTLIGRQPELAVLNEALADLRAGKGGGVTLVGDTGLGKTRLLREVISDDAVSLRLRGEPYGANSAYRMLRDPLRQIFGIDPAQDRSMPEQLLDLLRRVRPDLLPMASLLGDLLSVSIPPSPEVEAIDPQFRPDRRADVLIQALSAVEPGPVVVVVDEAHWCDEASAQLLSRVEIECETRPWLLLAARRDVAQGYVPDSGQTVQIGPMQDADIRTLVRVATDAAPLLSHEVDTVVRRAGGYPLFAEEIIRAARELGSIDAVPESLEAAMAIQVDALDRSARRVLQFASILGRSFSRTALAGLLEYDGESLDEGHLSRLEDFLVPEGGDRYQFRSSMLRDTVYESVAFRLRRRLHLAAGEELEARVSDPGEVADALAMHFYRAGDLDRAWRYARLAGDRARAKHANADAASHYEIALEAARRSGSVETGTCRAVWLDLGDTRMSAGSFDAAADAHRQALKLSKADPFARARVLFSFAKLRDRSGSPSSALRDLTSAQKLIDDVQQEEAAELSAELASFRANVLFGQDKLEKALESADIAVAMAEQTNAAVPLAVSLTIRDSARTMLEGPGESLDMLRALRIYESLGDLVSQGTVLTNLGVSVAYQGRWHEAMKHLEDARDRYERGGNSPEAALAAANIADLLLCQGHIEKAAELLEDALPVVRAARWAEGLCGIQLQLGHVRIEQDRHDEAEVLLVNAAEEFHRIGQPAAESEVTLIRAAGRVLLRDLAMAHVLLDAAVSQAGGDLGMLSPREALLRGIAHAQEGNLAEAILSSMKGIEQARAFELRYETGVLSRFALSVGLAGKVLAEDEQNSLRAAASGLADLGVIQPPRSYSWEPA